MATLTDKQADLGACVDDIASLFDGLSDWTDSDSNVVNDGSTGDWHNNGRVYYNSNMEIHLLFYVFDSDNDPAGIRMHVSEGWDTTNTAPSGRSNRHQYDPFNGANQTGLFGSFDNSNASEDEHGSAALNISKGNDMNLDRTYNATYFLSASNNYFNGAIWNTTDSNHGASGVFSIEHVQNKIWSDGNAPYAYMSINHHKDGIRRNEMAYGWATVDDGGTNESMHDVYNGAGFQRSWWGRVNPASHDDTYFFSKPVVFQTLSQSVPVAYIESCARNDPTEGASHGDIITYNGVDYRCMRQAGRANSTNVCVMLKFQ